MGCSAGRANTPAPAPTGSVAWFRAQPWMVAAFPVARDVFGLSRGRFQRLAHSGATHLAPGVRLMRFGFCWYVPLVDLAVAEGKFEEVFAVDCYR